MEVLDGAVREDSEVDDTPKLICDICSFVASSNTQLFRHLETNHGYVGKHTKVDLKVILLVGWKAPYVSDSEEWIPDHSDTTNIANSAQEYVERAVNEAVEAVEKAYVASLNKEMSESVFSDVASSAETCGVCSDCKTIQRPLASRGFTRSTGVGQRSSVLLSAEPSLNGGCDTFCLSVRRSWIGTGQKELDRWVGEINAHLPASVRVLHMYVPGHKDMFHAEMHCTHRLYECMLPMRLIVQPEEDTAANPITAKREAAATTAEAAAVAAGCAKSALHHQVNMLSPRNIVVKDTTAATEDPKQTRLLDFFTHLKRFLKIIAGKRSLHNFAAGGASPEDSAAYRRIDKLCHRKSVCIDGEDWLVFGVSVDALLRGQMRKLIGLVLGVMRGWLPLSYVYDALATTRELEETVPDNKMSRSRGTTIADVPSVPGFLVYITECKFSCWEAKYNTRIDPRRLQGGDCTVVDSWIAELQTHIAGIAKVQTSLLHTDGIWIKQFEEQCRALYGRFAKVRALQRRTAGELSDLYFKAFGKACDGPTVIVSTGVTTTSTGQQSTRVPALQKRGPSRKFDKRREVEKKAAAEGAAGACAGAVNDAKRINKRKKESTDGRISSESVVQTTKVEEEALLSMLPGETTAAAKVVEIEAAPLRDIPLPVCWRFLPSGGGGMTEVSGLYSHVLQLLQQADKSGWWPSTSTGRSAVINKATMAEYGGAGGSFTVGALPAHMVQPKMNEVFPALVNACFALEGALLPHRVPSTTIAVNRHTQFLPHRDTGAGHGQSKSLIVGLGDYVGGELIVENVVHDIRYNPLEFDGWNERHWTVPFAGERFSLVWFTPLGLGPTSPPPPPDLELK